MVKISIIVPCYNTKLYIEQCLQSLIEQTLKDIEIICVDGSSEDGSFEILKQFEKNDSRIKVCSKKNEGVSLSRNYAMSKAKGKYLMFVDADDWIDPNTCEIVYQKAEEQQADLVMWSYVREFKENSLPKDIFKEDEKIFEKDQIKQLHRRFFGLVEDELAQVENADALCPVWGKLYKRDIIEEHKIMFTDIREIGTYEDGMFNLEVFEHLHKVVYMQKHLYHYRKYNENSITSQYKENLFEQWNRLYDLLFQYIKDNNLNSSYLTAVNNRICLGILGQGLNLLESDRKNKRREIKTMLSTQRYREAYQQLELKYFPIHWKVFYGLAKHNIAWGVYGMLLCIQKMIGR
ncbi:glycosyltransferase family 2 protein [Anaerostipes faecalis]|uniref:glycosyltransferase family 2 protein n=1 Tax=Anaerostipes faecalis TaxID=2738446 RepID=UPI003F01D51B